MGEKRLSKTLSRSVESVECGHTGLGRGRSVLSKSVESVGVGGDTLRSARSVQSVRSVTIHPR